MAPHAPLPTQLLERLQRRPATGCLALLASSPEKCSPCLSAGASTRGTLGAVYSFSATEKQGNQNQLGALCP